MYTRALSIGILLFVLVPASVTPVKAEEILGCPCGIEAGAGTFWFRTRFKFDDMTERYNRGQDAMVPLGEGWHNRVNMQSYRFGYAISDGWDIGLVLTYMDVDRRIYNAQKEKWSEVDDEGFGDVWLAARHTFMHETNWAGFDEVFISGGAGMKFPATSDSEIRHGIGNGTDEFRIGLLTNWTTGRWEFCNHLTYTWRGEAPVIEGWNYSGQNLSNRLGYKFKVGYDLTGDGRFCPGIMFNGWMDMQDITFAPAFRNTGLDAERAYRHNITYQLEYYPDDEEKHKFVFGYSVPYDVKSGFAPDYTLSLLGMWTW